MLHSFIRSPWFLVIIVGLFAVYPCFLASAPQAWADTDDDDDDDDDDDGARPVRRAPPPPAPDYVPGEILLINPTEAALLRATELGFRVYSTEIFTATQLTIARLRLPPGIDAPAGLALLRRETPDQASELNHLYRLQQSPAAIPARDVYDCGSPRCYAQKMIGWNEQLAACSAGLRIGMIDTGIDRSHPALKGKPVDAVSFAPPFSRPSATQHGTAVAALLAGNGAQGLHGLLPAARLYAADVFHTDAAGRASADAVSLIRGFNWLRQQNVLVINVSLAGAPNQLVETAVRQLLDAGTIIVAAAGNDGPQAPPRHPAAIPGVIAVTAVDERRRVYRRAAAGPHIAFAAPGVNVTTAQPRRRTGASTGTSYAVPFVAAVAAIAAGDGKAGLDAIPAIDLGAPGIDPVFGRGLIQAPASCAVTASRN